MAQTKVELGKFEIQSIHSATLAADTSIVVLPTAGAQLNPLSFQPDFWKIVVRLTVGFILVYPGSQRGALSFKMNTGTITLPFNNDSFTIETVGATGFYSLYAHRGCEGFEIES